MTHERLYELKDLLEDGEPETPMNEIDQIKFALGRIGIPMRPQHNGNGVGG